MRWLQGLLGNKGTDRTRLAELINFGVELVGLKDYEGAIRSFDGALKIDPTCTEAIINKGAALGASGQHFEAHACFAKAVRLGDKRAESAAAFAKRSLLENRNNREYLAKRPAPDDIFSATITTSGAFITSPGFFEKLNVIVLFNNKAEIAGFVRLHLDGRVIPEAELMGNQDGVSALMFTMAAVSKSVSSRCREAVVTLFGLSRDEWTAAHRQAYLLVYLHHLQEAQWFNLPMPQHHVRGIAEILEDAILPSLPQPLSPILNDALRGDLIG